MNKAVFWDFDGTLVSSPLMWSGAVHRALVEQVGDCGVTLQDIRPFTRGCFPWHAPERDYTRATHGKWWDYMRRQFAGIYVRLGISESDAEAAARKVRELILRPENYRLFPDAVYILEQCLHLGYRNHIVSNNYPELDQTVEGLGIAGFFSEIIVSARIGYDKPRREIFEHALKAAGYPEKSLMVGDRPRADIEGARPLGMTTILVHNSEASTADYTFENLSDMLRVL